MSTLAEDPLETALTWSREGRSVALATVVDTWGSSPRPRGSQLAVRDDGLFVGSVSGGCVEGKVVEAAQAAMQNRVHQLLEFGVSDEEAWGVGLACGGTVRIYVEAVEVPEKSRPGSLNREVLERVERARTEKKALVLLTPLDGRKVRTWLPGQDGIASDLREAAERALASDDASTVESSEGAVFVQAINPPLRLVIVGAVHIAQPLSRIAALLGYEVTVVDPRESFARPERWPDVAVVNAWPDEALQKMTLDHRTAIVTLTHDPKIDDVALEEALKSNAFYVGALGSKKTHGSRLQRLGERGFSVDQLARIHGPVGLRIAARSPAEIAISIVAQMTEKLRTSNSTSAK